MTALVQNFSIPADNDVAVTLALDPNMGQETLEDCTIYWRAYPQAYGIPDFTGSPAALIEKSTPEGSILIGSPATTCVIDIARSDTVDLLRNYYHETTLIDVNGNVSTLNCGIMTVTATGYAL